jgi:hypothetical protein
MAKKSTHRSRRREKPTRGRSKLHHPKRQTSKVRAGRRKPKLWSGSRVVRKRTIDQRTRRVLQRLKKGESLSTATRREHIKPNTFLRRAGNKVGRKTPGGRFRLKSPAQSRIQILIVPSSTGPVRVPTTTLAQRRRFSAFENAIVHFNRTGDVSRLKPFKGKHFVTADGTRVEFVTDPATLIRLAEADALRIPHFYESVTSPA